MYYKTCPNCGAHLDPGEQCNCQDEKKVAQQRDHRTTYTGMSNRTLSASIVREKEGNCQVCSGMRFPNTPESFIAYQEQLAGRGLTGGERKIMAVWVKCFNLCYEEGQKKNRAALTEYLIELDKLIARRKKGHAAQIFLSKCRVCMVSSWEQGSQEQFVAENF